MLRWILVLMTVAGIGCSAAADAGSWSVGYSDYGRHGGYSVSYGRHHGSSFTALSFGAPAWGYGYADPWFLSSSYSAPARYYDDCYSGCGYYAGYYAPRYSSYGYVYGYRPSYGYASYGYGYRPSYGYTSYGYGYRPGYGYGYASYGYGRGYSRSHDRDHGYSYRRDSGYRNYGHDNRSYGRYERHDDRGYGRGGRYGDNRSGRGYTQNASYERGGNYRNETAYQRTREHTEDGDNHGGHGRQSREVR
jgi:hypothetical protein